MAGENLTNNKIDELVEGAIADHLIRKIDVINEASMDNPIAAYELADAGFRQRGNQMVKTIGYIEHRFIRVAKEMYVYDGQHSFDRP